MRSIRVPRQCGQHSRDQSSLIGEYFDDIDDDEAAGLPRGRLNIRNTDDDRDWFTSSAFISASSSVTSLCTACTSTIKLWSPPDLVVMRADDDAAVAERVRSSDVSFFFFICPSLAPANFPSNSATHPNPHFIILS